MTLLSAERLSKSFGGVVAAREVTFTVEAGKLIAIIGPNGAGNRPSQHDGANRSRRRRCSGG